VARQSWAWKDYGLGFEITETALEDLNAGQMRNLMESVAFHARQVEERFAARVFN
jgi:hypothetical protein